MQREDRLSCYVVTIFASPLWLGTRKSLSIKQNGLHEGTLKMLNQPVHTINRDLQWAHSSYAVTCCTANYFFRFWSKSLKNSFIRLVVMRAGSCFCHWLKGDFLLELDLLCLLISRTPSPFPFLSTEYLYRWDQSEIVIRQLPISHFPSIYKLFSSFIHSVANRFHCCDIVCVPATVVSWTHWPRRLSLLFGHWNISFYPF